MGNSCVYSLLTPYLLGDYSYTIFPVSYPHSLQTVHPQIIWLLVQKTLQQGFVSFVCFLVRGVIYSLSERDQRKWLSPFGHGVTHGNMAAFTTSITTQTHGAHAALVMRRRQIIINNSKPSVVLYIITRYRKQYTRFTTLVLRMH